jgi:hypothetical protein
VLTTEKVAEFAPMANARVRIAAAVKVGALPLTCARCTVHLERNL